MRHVFLSDGQKIIWCVDLYDIVVDGFYTSFFGAIQGYCMILECNIAPQLRYLVVEVALTRCYIITELSQQPEKPSWGSLPSDARPAFRALAQSSMGLSDELPKRGSSCSLWHLL